MNPRCHLLTLAVLTLLPAVAAPADDEPAAITIERVQWGFDGKAPERTFVPLSVLVQNNTPLEFEGSLRLTKLIQSTKPIDASIERAVYVGPLSSRWVQFVPYVVSDWEQWRLSWGQSSDEHYDIPTPQIGDPATVLLYDPEDLQLAGGVLRRFEVNLFPSSVTGTDALRGVAMDRAPRWQGARRQAFLDWLRRGGRVYLLQDDQGRFPTFPDSLGPLNNTATRYSVGAGTVERIASTVSELSPEFVKRQILTDEATTAEQRRYQQYRNSPRFQGTAPLLNQSGWDRDTQMFLDLQTVTRFARRWWVIYLLSLLYLFVMLPVCYRVGREGADYRWMYLALLLSVGLFSFGFASLGRLGASEVSRARSVAVAHQLTEGIYDVTQWTCVGVRTAGDYVVDFPGTGRQYTTAQDIERIDGRVIAGAEARLELDIPPASTRTILSRRRAEAVPLGLRVAKSEQDDQGLTALSLETGPQFPEDPPFLFVVHASRIYDLRQVGSTLHAVPSTRKPLSSYLTEHLQLSRVVGSLTLSPTMRGTNDDTDQPLDKIYELALRTLIGNSFGLRERIDRSRLQLPAGMLRVFVYAPQPPALEMPGDSFPDEAGYVLYCVDLPAQGGPTMPPVLEQPPADPPPVEARH